MPKSHAAFCVHTRVWRGGTHDRDGQKNRLSHHEAASASSSDWLLGSSNASLCGDGGQGADFGAKNAEGSVVHELGSFLKLELVHRRTGKRERDAGLEIIHRRW